MVLAAKQKRHTSSTHHKKRHGLHQKRSPHFVKTYWPYLPLMMIVIVGLAINSLWSVYGSHGVLGYATEVSVSELLNSTNSQRSSNSESVLHLNSQLDQAAQTKANDMVARNYWSHNTPDGTPPWTFITNAGYQYQAAGENLAYGFDTSSATIDGWMNSPEHRANILNSTYQDVGFGFANSSNFQGSGPETVVVAMYGKSIAASTPAPTVARTSVNPPPVKTSIKPSPLIATTTPTSPAPATAAPSPSPTSTPLHTSTPLATTTRAKQPTARIVPEPPTRNVSRVQIVTAGSAPWSLFAVSTLASAGIVIFIIKHGLVWRRAFVYGEMFVIKHRLLDITIVSLVMLSYVFSRTAGFIR